MKYIFTRIFSTAFLSLLFAGAIAQQTYFTDIAESAAKTTGQKRVIIPSKFRTLRLDTLNLSLFLSTLPSEKNILSSRNSTPILLLPMPDGRLAKFHIWESAAMAPELAALYPEIKTFTGQGIDDPTATIKVDWTEFGFHAMILSPITGTIMIDPYDNKTLTNYIAYYKTDHKKSGTYHELEPIRYNRGLLPQSKTNNVEAGSCTGTQLRTYRLAVACTGEYAKAATGLGTPTKAQTTAKIVTTVNRVNGVYEKEIAVRIVLIATNSNVVFTDPATDPFLGNNNTATLINESQRVIDSAIGTANYDIGHTFSSLGGGYAGVGVVCRNGQKASGVTGTTTPTGDAYDIDYVAHEMGHQFGAEHPFNSTLDACNGNGSPNTNAEPGSGSTIMAYAGICAADNLQPNSDAQFHAVSFDQITQYTGIDFGNSCAVVSNTANAAPVVNAGASYTIPLNTPFALTGSATDPNADALTYCWEQVDVGGPFGTWNAPSGDAPLFRSYLPVSTPVRNFPRLAYQLGTNTAIGEIMPSYARTMHFRLTARDNKAGGGGVCYAQTTVTTVAATGPFTVTYPNATGITWNVNEFQTITWNPAGTAAAPISCANVTIQLSTDGGLTYPTTLLATTANDGTEEIQVPNNVSTTCRIRVMAVGNVFYDISNANFRIQTPAASFALNSPAPVAACSAASGTATLKSASLAGFTGAITLTASLNPAGTTVSFGTTPLTPGSNTTVTLNNTNTLAAGTYTVRVTGTAGSIVKTSDILFVVGPGGSAPASLTTPASDAIGQAEVPSFNWTAVAGALSYTLEISTTANFAVIAQTVSGITTLPFTLTNTNALQQNTIYYWRVKTTNGCGTGAASVTPSRFKTALSTCKKSFDVPKAISATGTSTITSTITIPASAGAVITDLNVIGLKGNHTYVNDLSFTLTSPANTSVVILDHPCDGYADFDLNLDDQSANGVPCPPTGAVTAVPQNPLAVFNGQNSTGTWTLTVTDNFSGDGGSLTGWGLNINSNSTTNCIVTNTPLANTYTFTGNGNWNVASNWSNNTIPPSPLPANSAIVINHAIGGQCILNVTQQVAAGASFTIMAGRDLIIPGVLTMQ